MRKLLKFDSVTSPVPGAGAGIGYVFLDTIAGLIYDPSNTKLDILTPGQSVQVTVTDQTDADAMVQQIINAENIASSLILIPGAPSSPSVPTGFTVTADYGAIHITWDASTSAVGYYLLRSSDGSTYDKIATINSGTEYTDAITGTQYYEVSAYNTRGESAASSPSNATTLTPDQPQNLVATAGNYSVTLAWDIVTSATSYSVSYNVYRDSVLIASTSSPAYFDSSLTAGVEYTYEVTAVINGIEGTASGSDAATPTSLTAPTLSVSAGVYSASLTWAAIDGASGYNIYRSNSTGTEVLVASTSTASYIDTALDYNLTWYYKVSATVNGGESDLSGEDSATPTHSTFTSASPDPMSISGGTLTFTGIDFDPSQGGQIKYGTVEVNYLGVSYINSTTISVSVPGGLSAGSIQFYYTVGGGDYELPFTVAFT